MNIEQSKKLSIIDFLDKENVTLKKKKGNAYWYLSPFRDEKTASFILVVVYSLAAIAVSIALSTVAILLDAR